jgi:hypothetical protein
VNLMPFDEKAYHRLVREGYKYLLVKQRNPVRINQDFPEVQILKALKDCSSIPPEEKCESIDSPIIFELLHEPELVSFVIISEQA